MINYLEIAHLDMYVDHSREFFRISPSEEMSAFLLHM